MSYDHANRVTRVTNPATGETVGRYHYDDQGFRVRKTALDDDGVDRKETMLLYASMYFGVEIQKDVYTGEEIYNVLNNIYLNGVRVAAMVPTGEAAHFHTDQVDSVKVVTNDAGAVVSRMEYLPYGETWFQEGDDRFAPKYNSQELDKESGYYFYNARYYDPEICRFVTADTVIPDEYSTQSWNRFTYVRGNPIVSKDPSGHWDFSGLDTGQDSIGDQTLKNISTPISSDIYSSEATKEVVEGKTKKAKDSGDTRTVGGNDNIGVDRLKTIDGRKIPFSQEVYDNNKSIKVTSKFGNRTDPMDKSKLQFHPGIDIAAPKGTSVYATKDGTVRHAGVGDKGINEDYGNRIYLDHDGKQQTLYGHLDKIIVKPKQQVKAGQKIGEVGSTGLSTAPHLHFEVREDGVPVDPLGKKEN